MIGSVIDVTGELEATDPTGSGRDYGTEPGTETGTDRKHTTTAAPSTTTGDHAHA